MDGFEHMGAEFEGEESDHEGVMEETRSEWDDRDSSEGAQLSESSATNSEVFIHEPDWVGMYLRCPRWSEVWLSATRRRGVWPPGYHKEEGRLWASTKKVATNSRLVAA